MMQKALTETVALVFTAGFTALSQTQEHQDAKIKRIEEEVKAMGQGGVSGAPLRRRATEVVAYLQRKSAGQFPIIGVGGIDGPEAAREKMDAGACLVQVYSGMIYEGPGLAARMVKGIA